jgi:hypothetical protein
MNGPVYFWREGILEVVKKANGPRDFASPLVLSHLAYVCVGIDIHSGVMLF